jgi:2-polyprenyl-3-methyl-5-hydroxy-6-metoxy-1,4-benzoquinol methylase
LLKFLHRLKSANMAANSPTVAGQAVPLSRAEFEALVTRMDRGDFVFDQTTRERLIALWKQDNSAVPYPSAFQVVYQSDDALAMNCRELMEITYRLPYSLAYENTQKPAYDELIDLGIAHGVALEGECVADIGCGFGGLLRSVHERAPSARLFGIECADSAIAWMREHRPYITPVLADLALPPEQFGIVLGRPMDVVFCTAVLEHLEDPEHGLRNLLALAPRGMVVVAVPNGRIDTAAQHINFWSPESWRHFIARAAPDREAIILRARNPLAPGGFENAAVLKTRNR